MLARAKPESETDLQCLKLSLYSFGPGFWMQIGEMIKMNQTLQLTKFSIEVPMCRLSEKDVVVVGADI